MTDSKIYPWPKGILTEDEWRELLALEYILTWGFSDNPEQEEIRYKELSLKRWYSLGRK